MIAAVDPAERGLAGDMTERGLDRDDGSGILDIVDPTKRELDRNCDSRKMPHLVLGIL